MMKRIVLAGGGHSHLPTIKNAAMLIRAGAEVILIAPQRYHYYSGMGPGLLSGLYSESDARVDVKNLALSRGCEFIEGKVASIDPSAREVTLEGGEVVSYDILSINTGSKVKTGSFPVDFEKIFPVKPIENMARVRQRILGSGGDDPHRVAVIGGGPAGVEVSGNLLRLSEVMNCKIDVTLVEGADHLLPQVIPRAGKLALDSLEKRGARVLRGFMIKEVTSDKILSSGGETIHFDTAIVAVGTSPNPGFTDSPLPAAVDGGLLVNHHLQSVGHPEIFGGGDCISMEGNSLPRIGVYAVRQGPILLKNLLNSVNGDPLEPYLPQKKYLLIYNMGDGRGIAVWGKYVFSGRWVLRWKHYLDTSFMAKFQVEN